MEDLINARCGWAGTDELYIKYHDEEWGQPVTDDRTLFEFLVLESAQAGLSWITILRKREGYREAFHHFDVEKVAQMTQEDIADILGMSRVQITRELTHLRSRGILSTTRGRLTVTDLPALASLCTEETL